jgi:hypothetical protein
VAATLPAEDRLTALTVEAVQEQIQTVASALSTDELSAMASELGLGGEGLEAMLRDPAFAGLVAEELARAEAVDR